MPRMHLHFMKAVVCDHYEGCVTTREDAHPVSLLSGHYGKHCDTSEHNQHNAAVHTALWTANRKDDKKPLQGHTVRERGGILIQISLSIKPDHPAIHTFNQQIFLESLARDKGSMKPCCFGDNIFPRKKGKNAAFHMQIQLLV